MKSNGLSLLIAVEDEPFPPGPSGMSCRLKLEDWLDLAHQLEPEAQLEICPVNELEDRRPDVVEAFSGRLSLLSAATFPSLEEHALVSRFSHYWPVVERSGVPAIGVIRDEPRQFPVFVRGEECTFRGGGVVRTRSALRTLQQTGRELIVRPLVEIKPADKRAAVGRELRVHVIAGRTAAIEFLFPPWAAQRPTRQELENGQAWAESESARAAGYADTIGAQLHCRWFVADFAGTDAGLQLIELNPGWCAGIAHSQAARAVHVAIVQRIFGLARPKMGA